MTWYELRVTHPGYIVGELEKILIEQGADIIDGDLGQFTVRKGTEAGIRKWKDDLSRFSGITDMQMLKVEQLT